MPDMEEIGLIGLTHILNGGVRIQYNPSLCYARNGDSEDDVGSINWSKILKDEYYTFPQGGKVKGRKTIKKEYLVIEVFKASLSKEIKIDKFKRDANYTQFYNDYNLFIFLL